MALIISDFNAANLAAFLRTSWPSLEVEMCPFGQVAQSLLAADRRAAAVKPDFCVVWTRPESVLGAFGELLDGHRVDWERIYAEVDQFSDLLADAAPLSPVIFLPLWVIPTNHLGHGLGDLAAGTGLLRAVMAANLRLLDRCANLRHVYPLATQSWIERIGEAAFSPRLWFTGKIPFGNGVFKAASAAIASAWSGIQGRSRKLLVVDLDDTLWGGIVGDVGVEGLVLGGHDPVGEAFVEFQRILKAISRRGVALAIASKNDEPTALRAIQTHPEMRLTLDDFAARRINWSDKAANVAAIARELNIGLDSVVFLDDSRNERARVREALPEVLVPELPEDPRLYAEALLALTCFDKPAVTPEDMGRSQMYTEERKRAELRKAAVSLDDWLGTLQTVVTVAPLTMANAPRVVQLFNKTNQMNLRTRRMAEPELLAWKSEVRREIWAFRARDRFGDSGIVGILGLEADDGYAAITDFILSCRVMGRRIEETMLHVAAEWALKTGVNEVRAVYSATPKNSPCLEFFRHSGFVECPANCFVWNTARPYPLDPAIELIRGDEVGSNRPTDGTLVSSDRHG